MSEVEHVIRCKRKVVDLKTKTLILESIFEDNIKPAKLARQLCINRKTVESIARKAKNGHIFQTVEGRPRAFDAESFHNIKLFFQQNPPPTKDEKVATLQKNYKECCTRKGVLGPDCVLSRRSVGRYLKLLETQEI